MCPAKTIPPTSPRAARLPSPRSGRTTPSTWLPPSLETATPSLLRPTLTLAMAIRPEAVGLPIKGLMCNRQMVQRLSNLNSLAPTARVDACLVLGWIMRMSVAIVETCQPTAGRKMIHPQRAQSMPMSRCGYSRIGAECRVMDIATGRPSPTTSNVFAPGIKEAERSMPGPSANLLPLWLDGGRK